MENVLDISFVCRLDKKDKRKGALFARIVVNGGVPKEISLKQPVAPRDWDSSREEVVGKGPAVNVVNDQISETRIKLKECFKLLERHANGITAQDIKDLYKGKKTKRKAGHTVRELMKYHTQIFSDSLALGTMKNYVTTEEYVTRFMIACYNSEDLGLEEVDYEFITQLAYYIPRNPIKAHDKCNANGLAKHIERFKKMVKWAKKLRWIKENPVEDFVAGTQKYRRKRLQVAHFVTIELKSFANATVAYARDLFIFSCYSGFAYADALGLRPEDFDIGGSGKVWCKKYREKSEELAAIPLLPQAAKMIKKYMKDQRSIERGTIFPYISNQEYNRALKIIAAACEIPIDLQTHHARHFFAKEVLLKNGVPIKTVQMLLGHTKLSTTELYAEVDEELIEADTAHVERKMNKRKKVAVDVMTLVSEGSQ